MATGDDDIARLFVPPEVRQVLAADVATAEHRPVSVAFVMVPGIDRLTERGNEAELIEVLVRAATVADDSVREFGVCWTASDIAPDGFKLLFFAGAPNASEDDAGRILRTAAAFTDRCGDLGVRVGVNTGLAFAADIGHPRRRTFAIIGDTVNLAARLMGKSPPGGALVAPSTIEASRTSWVTADPVELTLKGKRRPVVALPLTGVGTNRARTSACPLVGRRAELHQLLAAASSVGSIGTSVGVVGDAGIGKSHLVEELGTAAEQQGVMVQRFAGSMFAGGPGLVESFTNDGETGTEPIDGDVEATIARRDRRHADLVERLVAADEPRVLIVEDTQWLDESSRLFLMQLLAARHSLRWMIVSTRRPGSEPVPVDAELELPAMELEDLLEISAPAAGSGWLRDDLERLAAQVDGNPLYFSEGVRLAPGATRLAASRGNELLAQRLDTLEPTSRRVARALAVIGRPVPRDVLITVSGSGPLRLDMFDGLVEARDELWWFAAEPLVDIARAGTATRLRRSVHEATAEIFEALQDELRVTPKELAVHHAGAGHRAQTWTWARRAAASMRAAGAIREATEMLQLALSGIEEAPADEVDSTVIELGELLVVLGQFDEADRLLRDTWRSVGRSTPPPWALLGRARAAEQAGRFTAADRFLARMATDPAATEIDTIDRLLLSGLVSHRRGRRSAAIAACNQALAAARRCGDDRRRAQAHLQLELIRWAQGHPNAARHESCAELLFRRTGDDRGLGVLLLNRGVNHLNEGPWDQALADCREAEEVLDRAGYLIDAALAAMNAGVVLIRQGRADVALARADHIAMVYNGLGWPEGLAYLNVSSGAGYAQLGRLDEAFACLDAAELVFESTNNFEFLGETRKQRALAMLLDRRSNDALAQVEQIDPAWFELDPALEVGVSWLRGHALMQLGDVETARSSLGNAWDIANGRGLVYDAAMTAWSLEMCAALRRDPVEAGRWRTIRAAGFEALRVSPDLPGLPV